MLRVGLTGGLASGKSFVGGQLQQLGCYLIKADDLGHEVLMPGAEAYDAVLAEFGPDILDADGAIDRRRLASVVFSAPERLARLNAIVHPAVRARAEQMHAAIASNETAAIIVTEAAILIETGSYRNYERLIIAVCRDEQQVERAMHRDGITREEAMARLRQQLPLAEKVKLADYVVDTSGDKASTIKRVREVYESLRAVEQRGRG